MTEPIQFDKVADLYDDYVTVDFDIPFFLAEARKVRGRVLELMAGTGRVSIPLLQAGTDLTCVDYSPAMLAKLQHKLELLGLSCDTHAMDVTRLSLPHQYDLILIPFHSFSEILERRKQEEALRRIHEHLTAHGRFICTLQNPRVRTGSIDGSLKTIGEFPTRSGFLILRSQLRHDPSSRMVSGKQFYDVCDHQRNLQHTLELDIHFFLHTRDGFEALLSTAGFGVDALFGDYAYTPFDEGTSHFMIWKLRRV